VAEPPDYRGRQLTRYTADDGQGIAGLEWTADAKALFYVRGGAANRQGDAPNPASAPAGAEQAVWRVGLDGGAAPVRIGAGSGIAVSPKGDGIAFTRRGEVFWAASGGAKKAEPVSWLKPRGGARQLRFSPDGARLAFVSARGDHSFIGLFDVATKTLRWIDPSVDSDGEPAWSPDGARLAFLRVPASTKDDAVPPQPERAALVDRGGGR